MISLVAAHANVFRVSSQHVCRLLFNRTGPSACTPQGQSVAAVTSRLATFRHCSSSSPSAAVVSPDTADAPCFDLPNPYQEPRRVCFACRNQLVFNYKNVRLLSQFVSSFTGRVYERRVTGLCKNQQKKLEAEISKATDMCFMPEKNKEVEFLKDPQLCDISNPVFPHRYC